MPSPASSEPTLSPTNLTAQLEGDARGGVAQEPFGRALRRFVVDSEGAGGFVDNSLTTSKYTAWNFVPKNVWEQFHRVANVYFLCIAGLQVSGYITPALDLSPTHKLATLAPLTVMVSITMIKEAIEDIARHREDGQVSAQPATVMLGRRQKRVVKWCDVKVGQVLEVRPA